MVRKGTDSLEEFESGDMVCQMDPHGARVTDCSWVDDLTTGQEGVVVSVLTGLELV